MHQPITVSAIDSATMMTLLIKAAVYQMKENQVSLSEGYEISVMTPGEDGVAHALVRAPSDEGYAKIDAAFAGNINIANAPVRIFLGDAMPEPAPSDLQFRLALSEVGIREDVEGYVARGDQSLKDWYDRTPVFEKTDPRIVQAIADMKMPAELVDQLWSTALTIKVPQ